MIQICISNTARRVLLSRLSDTFREYFHANWVICLRRSRTALPYAIVLSRHFEFIVFLCWNNKESFRYPFCVLLGHKDFDVSISKNSFFHFTDPNFNLLYLSISNLLSFFRCACAMVGERIAANIANVREGCKFSFTIVLGIDHTVNLLPSSDPGVVGETTILDKKWDYDLSSIRSSCEEFEESLVEDFERPSTVWSWFVGLSEFGSDDFSSRDSTN